MWENFDLDTDLVIAYLVFVGVIVWFGALPLVTFATKGAVAGVIHLVVIMAIHIAVCKKYAEWQDRY